jgi:outer membrane receptor protein involved in Fe transport
VNYLITLKSSGLPTAPLVEYAGTLGPVGSAGVGENGLNPGAFRWKMLNTFTYSVGPADVSLQWQHLPSAKSIAYPLDPDTPFVGSPAYELFNLSGSYRLAEDLTIRAGVDNLFNHEPPLVEYNPDAPGLANSIGANPFNAYFFDLNGRRFYLGASVNF